MKGYYNNVGYMGKVDGQWVLFASEQDYREYMEAQDEEEGAVERAGEREQRRCPLSLFYWS